MRTSTYGVIGMTCEHCVRSVTEEVGEVSGVSGVDVDLASGRLVVTAADDVPDAAIAEAVTEAGYSLGPAPA